MSEDLKDALKSIDVSSLDYTQWIQIGMAIKDAGLDVSVWDEWSRSDSRYKNGECQRKWDTFSGSATPVTSATIFQMAMERGWKRHRDDSAIGWDEAIEEKEHSDIEYDPEKDIEKYLNALFKDDDYVGYCVNSYKTEDGRYSPSSAGSYARTAGELLRELAKCNGDIGAVFGDYDENAGAWIRFNALDGKGVKNSNVKRFSYALVESDSLAIAEQNRIYRELNLPIAVLVHSGGKSLHAIVKVDAKDEKEYRERVDFLYRFLKDRGVSIDSQNRNPSRLSRMPGIKRGGKWQRITAVGIGAKSWDEWREWLDADTSGLPAVESLSSFADSAPSVPEELIKGVLRVGHKMLAAGPSKAGKSFSLMELAVAFAEKTKWLGFDVRQGKVMYVNLEIDRASCIKRFFEIYKALGIKPQHMDNISLWNLRGRALPLNKLVPKLLNKMRGKDYEALIIDPIYKVITGDENSAEDMALFCNEFDKICSEVKCAAIYCHHHSKGAQGFKKSIDRASGSGVLSRDPDAIIDFIELDVPQETYNQIAPEDGATAWRVEGSLREFKPFKPFNCWFTHPVHILDEDNNLKACYPAGSAEVNFALNSKRLQTPESRRRDFDTAFDVCSEHPNQCSAEAIMEYLGIKQRTLYSRIKEFSGDYAYANDMVFRVVKEVCNE